jgi:hypothetical protein
LIVEITFYRLQSRINVAEGDLILFEKLDGLCAGIKKPAIN